MEHLEEHWTKADMFHFFNVQNNKEIINTGQIIGGIFFIKIRPEHDPSIRKWSSSWKTIQTLLTTLHLK